MTDVDPHRLPRNARPEHYDLALEPDLAAGTFAGDATIRVRVLEAGRELVCNALDLVVDDAWIDHEGERINLAISHDAATERVTFRAPQPLAVGVGSLHLRFRGELNDKLRGFYRSRFQADDGTEHVLATTQFEATDARRAFPCWDEPEYKAPFGITLVVPEGLQAVSNSQPIEETEVGDGRRRIRFADTMAMSTYLVAFVVGPLEFTEPIDVDGVPLRVVHTPGRGRLTDFALETGAFALRYFTDYYGIPYPGDKIDLVAIPDFAFGAMENLGCVTFRETLLLVDPAEVTQPELQRVADVINHELAHMWFGDLVTMRWWNGIWLNEAFATFMEMKCTDAFRPQWQRWTDFGLSRSAAMDIDSLATTRPIEYEVRSPADAEGMFDLLTYEKGAAVVRMLEQYLGEDAFREGIRRYLTTHAYGNTETHDLWDALEAATGEPVRRMMDSWIFQGGHPAVTVHGGGATTVSQRRFRYLPDPDGDTADWVVPLRVRTDDGEARALLEKPSQELDLQVATLRSANVEGTGFYRVRLDDDQLAHLAAEGPEGLSPIERYGLIDDTWALVLAGDVSAAQFCAVVAAFRGEADISVWQRIIGACDTLRRATDTATLPAFRHWFLDLIAPARSRLGDEPVADEDARTGQLRGALFSAAGILGDDEAAITRARALADLSGDPALVAAAIDIVAAHGDAATHAQYVERMRSAPSPQEGERYRGALADFPGADEIRRTLELALDGTIRSQDVPFVIRRSLRNHEQGPTAWAFVTERWDAITAAIPSNLVARLLEGIAALAEPDTAAAVAAFLDAHPVPQGRTVIEQHRERLLVQAAFRARAAEPRRRLRRRVTTTVFAVEDESAQVIVRDGDAVRAVDVDGLEPGTTQTVTVEGTPVAISTLAPPPGRLLSRIATLSDLHLGATHHFGVRDDARHDTPFTIRCTQAAVREALAWGAEALVFKGDVTQHGLVDEVEQLAAILDGIDVPVGLLLGNHDNRATKDGHDDVRALLADVGRPFDDVAQLDVAGATVLLVDTTIPGRESGRVSHATAHAATCAADAPGPVVVMLHHHLQPWPVPTAYPLGVPSPSAGRFLRAMREANPSLFVTSGHSHRHHAHVRHGVPITQVGSVKDFPGVWAGYAIHEGGIRQVVRRIADPDCIEWTERTAASLWGLWGRWTPGRLAHRCLTHAWPTT